MSSPRLPALDGLRGLAILLVIFHHSLAGKPEPSASALEWVVRGAASEAWIGVDCFFALSGFLVTGILLDTRGGPGALKNFLARRALRTFPLYYAVVFTCLVVLPVFTFFDGLRALSPYQAWFWLHLSNFYVIQHGILAGDGPPIGWMSTFWSLSVEEHFYLAWAVIVTLTPPRRLTAVLYVALASTFGLRVALALTGYGEVVSDCTFTRLDALLLGSLVAMGSRRPEGLTSLVAGARLALVLAVAIFFVPSLGLERGLFGYTLRYSVAALLFASLLVLAIDCERSPGSLLRRGLSHPSLRACGKYSYAMYMFNKPILIALEVAFASMGVPLLVGRGATLAGLYVLAVALSLLAALVSWHALEKHCLKLKAIFAPKTARLTSVG